MLHLRLIEVSFLTAISSWLTVWRNASFELTRRLQSRIVRGIEHHQALGEASRDGPDQAIVIQAQDLE